MKRRLFALLLIISSSLSSLALALPAPAAAVNCSRVIYGRCLDVTYYSGAPDPRSTGPLPLDNDIIYWDSVSPAFWDRTHEWAFPSPCSNQTELNAAGDAGQPLPPCVVDPGYVNTFIGFMQGKLFNPNFACIEPVPTDTSACAYARRGAIGTSSIINAMMNQQGPSFTGASQYASYVNGVNRARSLFSTWADLVRAYNSRGQVKWDVLTAQVANHTNSTSVNYSQDIVFFNNVNTYAVAEIVFYDESGNPIFELNRRCANMNGAISPLPGFNVSGLLQSGAGTPPGGTQTSPGGPVQSGIDYVVRPGAWNLGPGQAPSQTYTLTFPSTVSVTSAGGGSVSGNTITWTGINLPSTGIGSAVFRDVGFRVKPGSPNGTIVTFSLVVGPHDPTGANSSPVTVSYEVQDPRYPDVKGENGDIHAGGGVCDLPTAKGRAEGHAKATTAGQYVVSSSDLLSHIGSNGSGDSLKLGAGGGYSRACRPDLLALADEYVAHGGKVNDLPCDPAACDFAITSATGSGVYIYNGTSPLTVRGLVSNKITIVSKKAPVRINGAITLANLEYSPRNLPSLGIISAGDISIPAAVTRVDAYLYSAGAINTCVEASSACATPPLQINGFIMGKTLRLNRIGSANSQGDQLAERIVLNPQIYLNPPAIFDAHSVDGAPSGLGEMPPLF